MEDMKQESIQKNCTRCGKELEEKTAFCPACGLPVEMPKEKKEDVKEGKTIISQTIVVNNVVADKPQKDK